MPGTVCRARWRTDSEPLAQHSLICIGIHELLHHAVFGVREGIRGAEREKLVQDAAAQGTPIEAQDTQPAQKQ